MAPPPEATRAPATGGVCIRSQKFPGGGLVLPQCPGATRAPHTGPPSTPALVHGGPEPPPRPQPRAPPAATTAPHTGRSSTPRLLHGGLEPPPRPQPLAPPAPTRASSTGAPRIHGGLELPPFRFHGGAEPPSTQRKPLRSLRGTEAPSASREQQQPYIRGMGHPLPAPRKRQTSIGEVEQPPPCILASTPAPAPEQAPSQSAAIRIADKYICSVLGAIMFLILVYYPMMYFVNTGNFEKTMELWNLTGIEIGLANALIWLLHASSVLTRDKTYDVLLTSGMFIGANLCFLLTVCGHQGRKRRGWIWFISTMILVLISLTIIQLEPGTHAVVILELTFGFIGAFLLSACHLYQIYDLYNVSDKVQLKTVLATVLPSFIFALVQAFITFASHRNQLFMMIQCVINVVCYPVEVVIATEMYDTMRKESKRLMNKMPSSKDLLQKLHTSFRRMSMSRSIKKLYDDEESLKHSSREETEIEDITNLGADEMSGSVDKQYDDKEPLKNPASEESDLEDIIHLGADEMYYWEWIHEKQLLEHKLEASGQSFKEKEGTFSYQPSVDVFKKDNSDNDLFILHVILQSLCSLRHFKEKFLLEPLSSISTVENISISQMFHEAFSAWDQNNYQLTDALLASVNTFLCGSADENKEHYKVDEDFACEVVATILIGLHMSETSLGFCFNEKTERNIVNPITSGDCTCSTHDIFGIKFDVQMSCKCGKSPNDEGYLYTTLFHILDAGSPQTTKIKSFAELPVLLDEQFCVDNICEHCGSTKNKDLIISNRPQLFTIVLSWLGCSEIKDTLSEVLVDMASPVDAEFFCKSAHSSTMYAVASMICYVDDRYVCCAHSEDKWLIYDSDTVETKDTWEHLLEHFKDCKLQPEVLFFEVIK